jgi:leucine dehydrogenase
VSIERETPLVGLDHEELVVRKGRRTGVYTIVAVHSTALGPSLGGCRLWRYADSAAGTRDALRLSRAMTFKAAAAGLSLGGGKGVICAEPGDAPTGARRRDLLLDFADTVNALEGRYVTAEDVGTSSRDMALIAKETKWVTGLSRRLGGSGDPSPFTALGVEAAIRACCQRRFGSRDLKRRTVAVVGLGHVGSQLAKRLSKAGARILAGDINAERREVVEDLPGATWADPSTALLAEVDVLAPCALGSAIDEVTVRKVQCQIVCGAANNQLAHDGLADDLAARGILFAPDYIANAGGLINISIELEGYDPRRAQERVAGIEQTMGQILDQAEAAGITPLAAANDHARMRLAAARAASR